MKNQQMQLPRGWKIKKLGEILKLEYGKPLPDEKRSLNGKYPVYGANGLKDRSNDYYFDKKTIIVGRKGSAGEINLTEDKFWPLDVTYFVTFDLKEYDLLFLFYLLSSLELPKLAKGIKPGINRNEVYGIEVKIPSISEQQQIVSILDECFAAIDKAKANAEQNLKNAKELFESYLQGVFEKKGDDWQNTRLGDICEIKDGTHFSPKNTTEGDFMYVTAKNIKPYFLDLSNITYVSESDHRIIYSRCSPKKGDVLYIKDGATAGIATINTIEEEFSMLSSVSLLKCSERILNTFLVHYMNSIVGKKNFLGYLDGAAITRLTLVKIKNICFPLPPIKNQKTIVRKLDALRAETQKLESIYLKKITDLEELKKSILQKAFAGELNTEKQEINHDTHTF
jgi:type I restriction enzyme S subunit